MADTNFTGAIYGNRQGSATVRQTFVTPPITDVATKFMRVQASAQKPVIIEAQVCVLTVDASETVSVGYTGAGYNDLVSAAALDTAATGGTFLPASNSVGKKYLTADTDLYYIGSAGADTGVVAIILDITTVNTSTTTGI